MGEGRGPGPAGGRRGSLEEAAIGRSKRGYLACPPPAYPEPGTPRLNVSELQLLYSPVSDLWSAASISDLTLGNGGPHLLHPHPSTPLPFSILTRPGPGLGAESAGPTPLTQEAKGQSERLRICRSPAPLGCARPRRPLLPGGGWECTISRRSPEPGTLRAVERRLTAGGLGFVGIPSNPAGAHSSLKATGGVQPRHCFPSQPYLLTPP